MTSIAPRVSRALRATTLASSLAAALAACGDPVTSTDSASASPAFSASASTPEVTLGWNELARTLVAQTSTSAPASIRTFALLSVAQHNAIVAAEDARPRAAEAGAIAGASAAVLAYVYPQAAPVLQARVAAERAATRTPGASGDFAAGEAIGRSVAAGLIERARTDRFSATFTGTVPLCDACWRAVPTPPAFATLGQAKTYLLESSSQFRPAMHPAFGSPEFLAALAEVRQIADTRTAEQDSIAKFWALPAGTIGAQGYFNFVAADLARRYHRTELQAARTLALLNIAAYDGIVASHEAKYHYWLLRPSQADPAIVRAIGLPSFPAYPSNHSMLAGVAAAVLGAQFPAERRRLDAMAEEAAISRLYGGIHYRFDTEAGLALGRTVAAWTLAHDVRNGAPFVFQP
jgi:hypothetical protein